MNTETERLQAAQWMLERNLAWIAAAEVKVGVIVAIDTAMLGGLGVAFSAADVKTRTYWAILFTLVAAILICRRLDYRCDGCASPSDGAREITAVLRPDW